MESESRLEKRKPERELWEVHARAQLHEGMNT